MSRYETFLRFVNTKHIINYYNILVVAILVVLARQ